MQEILQSRMEDFDGQIEVLKIMEKVKQCKVKGCDYQMIDAKDRSPAGWCTWHHVEPDNSFVMVI